MNFFKKKGKNSVRIVALIMLLFMVLTTVGSGIFAARGITGGEEEASYDNSGISEISAEDLSLLLQDSAGTAITLDANALASDTAGEASSAATDSAASGKTEEGIGVSESGVYTSKDDVALYIHTYGKLPSNFITKSEAKKLGWSGGGLDEFAEGKCIGGDKFGNNEGKLPEGKNYKECDIDTLGADSRGAKRIVYADDGSVYYTDDHYENFEQVY
ncbi:ribonuclease domain-containing protein [Butyrivibrio sp. M55]|uniref:ribonuclease domain-containing protein n=1 Tax=Butyrivibrio sp. M55 TaxID=1855323 RepID=UPI0008E54971|nr:ribonuclease domain-containing protein [Butyrivibrio sp. M55]SFU65736.1 ribonuclease [Butyrivibrio sp. M55]